MLKRMGVLIPLCAVINLTSFALAHTFGWFMHGRKQDDMYLALTVAIGSPNAISLPNVNDCESLDISNLTTTREQYEGAVRHFKLAISKAPSGCDQEFEPLLSTVNAKVSAFFDVKSLGLHTRLAKIVTEVFEQLDAFVGTLSGKGAVTNDEVSDVLKNVVTILQPATMPFFAEWGLAAVAIDKDSPLERHQHHHTTCFPGMCWSR
jgi:hypothetical protein